MEIRALKPYFVVIGLLIATSLALAFTVDPTVTDQAGIRVYLPDEAGDWKGDELRFCQAPACQETFTVSELTNRDVCPKCGGKLDCMTRSERGLLPLDTIVLKKRYTSPGGHVLYASIVMSGRERASIHRPQICLVGQGNEIVHSAVMTVPIAGRGPLDVMVLDMLRRWHTAEGRQMEYASFYAYWFVGKGRETPYHLTRMYWMAMDRILHNRAHRWAYIAVSGNRDSHDEYRAEAAALIGQIYPEMVLN